MKLINKEFEKRINAILYFCMKVKYRGKTKIYKLLYFLDFIHFKQVGKPVTDLEYYAFDYGPVPLKLHEEIERDKIPEELKRCIDISPIKDPSTRETKLIEFIPKRKPNLEVFSERERQILEHIAFIFKDAKAEEMSEISHLKNEPWDMTIKNSGRLSKIDFNLALDKDALVNKETAEERVELINEMKKLFG